MKNILFVCSGNTCRSPMAQAVFNALTQELGLDAAAKSAGVAVWMPSGPSQGAMVIMEEYGLDITSHRSRMLTEEILSSSDRVYCMNDTIRDYIAKKWPAYASRCALLAPGGIPDPFGGGYDEYRRAAESIIRAVKALLLAMKEEEENA